MRRALDYFCRYLVGGLLIFSGLVKLNDPIGTQIKMEEYFEVFAGDFGSFFHYFVPWALEIGLFMIVLEIALGVAILLFWRMRLTTWITLLMMGFFTFLTFYSAYFNKVTDCGCFGDFIKLTPWQSFTKDVVLDVLILHLFWYRRRYRPAIFRVGGTVSLLGVILLSVAVGLYIVKHLPVFDFRTYKIGNNIPELMVAPETPLIEYTFEKDGDEVSSQTFLAADEGYKYVSSRILNEDRITPPISDFYVSTTDGEDMTQVMFEGTKLLVVMVNVNKASVTYIEAVSALVANLSGKVDCVILSSSSADEIEAFRHEHQLGIPFYLADATVLKTIIRANPGLTLWKDGTVLNKWHAVDTPTADEILELE